MRGTMVGDELDPDEIGLLVVDVQNGYCHPHGARARLLGPERNLAPQEMVAPVLRLVRLCGALGLRRWFTRMVDRPDDTGRARHRLRSGVERLGGRIDLCPEGSWDAELVAEVNAELCPDDEVVVKHRASAFYGTNLESGMRMAGVHVLVVAGTTTSYCVDATIHDADARDFTVIVPADCVSDTRAEDHEAVLRSVDRLHGTVTDLAGLEAMLS